MIESKRLMLRELKTEDTPFILKLVNDPGWLKYIGDRGIRDLKGAEEYILKGPVKSYKDNNFGLRLIIEKESGNSIGICGLIKRETLPDVDVGFAFLPEYCGKGYATESSLAILNYAKEKLGIIRVVAITKQNNFASMKVLEKLGMKYERLVKISEDEPENKLYSIEL